MIWTILFLTMYSIGRVLSAHQLQTILANTRPTTGKKHKDTYIVKPSALHRMPFLRHLNNLPVQIVSVNGHPVRNPFYSLNIPTPIVQKMAAYPPATHTITHYLDKYTLTPVLSLLPNQIIYPHNADLTTALQRINHASRRDLAYRTKLR